MEENLKVRIGSDLSNQYRIGNGTPQGSVICPPLFIVMINDTKVPVEVGPCLQMMGHEKEKRTWNMQSEKCTGN